MSESETWKTPPARETRLSWRVIGVLGVLAIVLLRGFAREVGMPIWVANLLWICIAVGLVSMRARATGVDAMRKDAMRAWQGITEWLAVTAWMRLLAVAVLLLIAFSIVFDADELPALLVAALFGLAALKLAQAPRPPAATDVAVDKPAQAPKPGITPRAGNWLQRLSWTRLLLVGCLLLIAAGVANHLLESEEHSSLLSIGEGAPVALEKAKQEAEKARLAAEHASAKIDSPNASEPAETPDAEMDGASASTSASGVAITLGNDARQGGTSVSVGKNGILIVKVDANGKTKKLVLIGRQGISVSDGQGADVHLPVIEGMTPEDRRAIEAEIHAMIAGVSATALNTGRGFNFASLAVIAIVSLIVMKLLAGGKRRAELDADSARVAADIARLEREAADAKLHAMQAQIEPHFLFNTLASVDQLIQTDPPRASQVQKTLIQYLRAAIPQIRDDAQRSTLGRQVAMSRAYLEIMQVRMEERLAFAILAPDGLLSAEFPSMMLQTLIENCIKHGLEPKPEGGRIDLTAEVARGKLRVQVSDTGAGLAGARRDGVGLANIRERLALLYGNAALLSVVPNPLGGTLAIIEVPYKDEAERSA